MNKDILELKFEDKKGTDITKVILEENQYIFTLRGIHFKCNTLIDLIVPKSELAEADNLFDLNNESLVNYKITTVMPLQFSYKNKIIIRDMIIIFNVLENDYEAEVKNIEIGNKNYNVNKIFSYERLLINLQKKLLSHAELQACISCKFSCFYPGGNDGYEIACFKPKEERFSEIKGKEERLFELFIEEGNLYHPVSYVCDRYERISKNDWNYSEWSDYIIQEN